MSSSHRDYQERIRLDRYAIKDQQSAVKEGDTVVVSLKRQFERDGETVESREVGVVKHVNNDPTNPLFTVALRDQEAPQEDWEEVEGLERHQVEILVEKTYADICTRVATAVIAKEPENVEFREAVYDHMTNERFVPAGRILTGLGRDDYDLTLFNCYVFNIDQDSREGISNHWFRIFDTFSRGGGIGWDLSILRPRGAIVKKVSGRSSGAVTWGEQFSQITGTVEQGGSRRGASMQTLWCWHPDIYEFIGAKAQREQFTLNGEQHSRSLELLKNSNVSMLISNAFMEAVKRDDPWELVFPDLDDPEYDDVWKGDLDDWKERGKTVVKYKTIRARHLWNTIITKAWESGEPGLLFIERSNNLSNSWYFSKIMCSNPCAEQVLPPNSVCNLAHLHLAKFIKEGTEHYPPYERSHADAINCFDFELLEEVTKMGVRFLDNVTEVNKYHDDRIKEQQEGERRVGLGILGYGELLVRLGLRYGSDAAENFTYDLFKKFSEYSYLASTDLAKERGPFPKFDREKFLQSGYMKGQQPHIIEAVKAHGVRNVTINTIAPTGSVGTMMGTTTGIEPYFLAEWVARSRIGLADEEANVLEALKAKYGEDIPSYFVTTADITPEEHVKTQAAAQRWIDSSISKTINMPNDATVEDVSNAYISLYDSGCKGGTVYRDGSRDRQVLYTSGKGEGEQEENITVDVIDDYMGGAGGILRPKTQVGLAPLFSVETPIGWVHIAIRHHPMSGDPYDVFITSGKGDVAADTQALGRLISVILRWPDGKAIPQSTRLEIIRDQLYRIPGRGQIGIGTNAVISLPDGISRAFHLYLSGEFPLSSTVFSEDKILQRVADIEDDAVREAVAKILLSTATVPANKEKKSVPTEMMGSSKSTVGAKNFEICPECHNAGLLDVQGHCNHCVICGFSLC